MCSITKHGLCSYLYSVILPHPVPDKAISFRNCSSGNSDSCGGFKKKFVKRPKPNLVLLGGPHNPSVLHYLSPRSLQCLNSTLSTPILFSGFVSIILFFLITNVITAQRKYLDNDEETSLAFENRFTLKIGFYILKVFPRSSRDGRCVMLGGG